MNDAEEFLYQLHFDTEKLFPKDWQVDWEDAPLPFKLYRGLPEFSLPPEVPLSFKKRKAHFPPTVEEIGQFLWYIFGITQYAQTAFAPWGGPEGKTTIVQSYRRFVPSGGGLYPNELYLYLKLDEIPHGIYHYTVAHHRLVMIREGNYDSYLSRCLGNSIAISKCFATLFVSTVFWKNFYKYHNFSYRLQGLDAGVVIGQALEMAERMEVSVRACYQFLDQPVNHLLGLAAEDESVYSVLPLSNQLLIDDHESSESIFSAPELMEEIPPIKHDTYQRSTKIIAYPMLRKLTKTSAFDSTASFVKEETHQREENFSKLEMIMLPLEDSERYDLAAVIKERHSPESDFILETVNLAQLAALLKESFSFSYLHDLGNDRNIFARLGLYGCFYHVEGIPDGLYRYFRNAHAFIRISKGDYRRELQYGLKMDNINLFQVPLCFHIVGDKNHLVDQWGIRGYRIQQMEAGILVQRLLLAAGALGMGGHPLLGFDVKTSDTLYRLDSQNKTSLIQVPVGPYRARSWLKGSLYG